MPRKPKQTHPYRNLRKILGLSQAELARKAGISSSTLKQIENGKRPITEEVANRIGYVTGFFVQELLGKFICANGLADDPTTPYAKEQYDQMLKDYGSGNTKLKVGLKRTVGNRIELLFDAASRPGVGKSLPLFIACLNMIDKLIEEFALRPNMDAELNERHSYKTTKYQVGFLRKNPPVAKFIGFKDDPKLRDDEEFLYQRAVGWTDKREAELFLRENFLDLVKIYQHKTTKPNEPLPPELEKREKEMEFQIKQLEDGFGVPPPPE